MSKRSELDNTIHELSAILVELDLPALEKRFEACIGLARLAHAEIRCKVESAANAYRDYHCRPGLEPAVANRVIKERESMHQSAKLQRAMENLMDAYDGTKALAEEFHAIAGKIQWSTRPR